MGECLIIKSGGLDTSDANATNDKVLQGYTCYVNDILITGTMVVYGTKGKFDTTMSAEDSRPVINIADGWPVWIIENRDKVNRICIPIPFLGVYDDHSYIGVEFSKIRQTVLDKLTLGTNATTDSIYTGVVGYVNGSRVVGTMPDNNAVSYMLPVNTTYWIPVGYHNGGGYVTQSVPLQGGWTITPSVNNIVACWAGHYTTGDIWCAGDANLVPWNIRNGFNIFGVTGTFSGWVDGWVSWDAPGIGGQRTVLINWEVNSYDYSLASIFAVHFPAETVTSLMNQGFKTIRLDCSVRVTSNEYKSYGYTTRVGGNKFGGSASIIKTYTIPVGSSQTVEGTGTANFVTGRMQTISIHTNHNPYGGTTQGRRLKILLNWANVWVCK